MSRSVTLTSGDAEAFLNHPVDEEEWRESILGCFAEPMLAALDYTNMLIEASGRVLVLSYFFAG